METYLLIGIGILNLGFLTRVIWVQSKQTKSQNEIIKNMKTYSSFMNDYTKIFDMDLVKKYVANEGTIMNQDTEIIRRKVVKETTEKVSEEFMKSIWLFRFDLCHLFRLECASDFGQTVPLDSP